MGPLIVNFSSSSVAMAAGNVTKNWGWITQAVAVLATERDKKGTKFGDQGTHEYFF